MRVSALCDRRKVAVDLGGLGALQRLRGRSAGNAVLLDRDKAFEAAKIAAVGVPVDQDNSHACDRRPRPRASRISSNNATGRHQPGGSHRAAVPPILESSSSRRPLSDRICITR